MSKPDAVGAARVAPEAETGGGLGRRWLELGTDVSGWWLGWQGLA